MKIVFEGNKVSVLSLIRRDFFLSDFKKIPFQKIRDDLFAEDYELSISLIGKQRIKNLNFRYRNINRPTDVLSFEVDKKMGEIFICPEIATLKAPHFGMKPGDYFLFLVIHAVLHLKGFEHNSKMEKYERSYYSRYRYRNL